MTLVCRISMLQVIVSIWYQQQATTKKFGDKFYKKYPFQHPCEFIAQGDFMGLF